MMDGTRVKAWYFNVHLLALTTIFHWPYRIAASPPLGWMLCSNSWRGELSPLEMVSHISTPSRSVSLLVSPPAKPYKVGTQSDTCIRSRLTRPPDFNKGLWTNAAPRTPPVNKIYSQNHSSKSKLNRDCLVWKIKKNKYQPPHFFQAEEVTVLILTFSESTSWIYIFLNFPVRLIGSRILK